MSIDQLLDAPMNVKDMTTEVEKHQAKMPILDERLGIIEEDLSNVREELIDEFSGDNTRADYFSYARTQILLIGIELFGDEFLKNIDSVTISEEFSQDILSYFTNQQQFNFDPTSSQKIYLLKKLNPELYKKHEANMNIHLGFIEDYLDRKESNYFQEIEKPEKNTREVLDMIYFEGLMGKNRKAQEHLDKYWQMIDEQYHSHVMPGSAGLLEFGAIIKLISKEKFNSININIDKLIKNFNFLKTDVDRSDFAVPLLILTDDLVLGKNGLELNKSKQNQEIDTAEFPPLPEIRRFGK